MWRFLLGASFLLGTGLALVLSPAAGARAKTKADPKGGPATTPIIILYGTEHKELALALAKAYNVDAKYVFAAAFSTKASAFPGLTTLIAWGHSDGIEKFSEMTSDKFVELITAWRQANPGLKTVEILTCDARHNAKGEPQGPYAKRVAAGVQKKYRDLTIKALPIGRAADDCSILMAQVTPPTFCYITAPNKLVLDKARQAVLDLNTQLKADLSLIGNELAKNPNRPQQVSQRQYTLNYGPLKNVRSQLGVVK
jgi:hypothetical protein